MIISTIAAASSLLTPADIAEDVSALAKESDQTQCVQTVGSELEDKVKVGVSVAYTYSFERMDDARTWD